LVTECGSFQVIGLGQCCWDRLHLVDRYPAVDEKTEIKQSLEQGGGPVATALVTLSRLGVSCACCGSVGGDPEGGLIRKSLEQEGIDCEDLQMDPTGSSQQATIIVETGSALRTIFWQRGARRPFVVSPDFQQRLCACSILLLDGLDAAAALEAARLARKAGVATVLDGGTLREGSRQLLPFIDHLVVSARFARQYAGSEHPEDALSALAEHGAAAVTVTAGEQGSWSLAGKTRFSQPAFRVDPVDTTGCGDVFHGGYIYGLLQQWSLPRTVRFAAACAALKTRQLGGRSAIPSLRDVFQLEDSGDA